MLSEFLTAARSIPAEEAFNEIIVNAVVWIFAAGNLCTPLFIVVSSGPLFILLARSRQVCFCCLRVQRRWYLDCKLTARSECRRRTTGATGRGENVSCKMGRQSSRWNKPF